MDCKINGGVSFQANLISHVKGKNKIMEPVAKKFSKLTESIPGEFVVGKSYPSASKYNNITDFSYGKSRIITDEFNKYLSLKDEEITPSRVRTAAQKLANTLKAMQTGNNYQEEVKTLGSKIRTLGRCLKRAEKSKLRAQKLGLTELYGTYDSAINNYKSQISELKIKIKALQEQTLTDLDSIKKKGVGLENYADSIKYLFRHNIV